MSLTDITDQEESAWVIYRDSQIQEGRPRRQLRRDEFIAGIRVGQDMPVEITWEAWRAEIREAVGLGWAVIEKAALNNGSLRGILRRGGPNGIDEALIATYFCARLEHGRVSIKRREV